MLEANGRLHRIPHEHHPLVGKIGVDRAGRVGNHEALLEARPAARTNLRLDADGKARLESEWDQRGDAAVENERVRFSDAVGRRVPGSLSVGALDRASTNVGVEVVARRAFGRASGW